MQVHRVMNAVSGDGDEQLIVLFLLLWKQRLKQTPLVERAGCLLHSVLSPG